MSTVYKIHPAIGIARVGNSPDELFVGPEHLNEQPDPPDGFKDAQFRVKRQAARFHIFAHHDDGTVSPVTSAEAEIRWTVHLVNSKAANPGRGNSEPPADLTIDPGPRTLTGPSQQAAFDTGTITFSDFPAVTVALGEIRSDEDGRLLVLGGAGTSASPPGTGIASFWANDDWYDDVADGPVTAAITLREDGSEPEVVGAWVITAPPKYAPHNENVITLYDRIQQALTDGGLLTAPTVTSYTEHVYPILQRARDTQWVKNVSGGPHAWPDPVYDDALRAHIFARVTAPDAARRDMPQLNESTRDGRLTRTQYAHLERWKNGEYAQDWSEPPAVQSELTPDGLDRAALEACVGGSFFPGIEAGGRNDDERPILVSGNYLEPFRLNHAALSPGAITHTMALPWQADFNACGEGWWPVPRPNQVLPDGTSGYVEWDRGIASYQDMIDHWYTLGFVVRQGAQHVEVDRQTPEPELAVGARARAAAARPETQPDVLFDAAGQLREGEVQRVPFFVTRGDAGVEVRLHVAQPSAVDFRVQAPNGQLLEPWRAAAAYASDGGSASYRLSLPLELQPGRANHEGTWHALFRVGAPRLAPAPDPEQVDRSIVHRSDPQPSAAVVDYRLVVTAFPDAAWSA